MTGMTFQYDLSSAVFSMPVWTIADDRLDVAHHLALERGEEAQHAVRGRVVGTEVEGQQLLVLGVREVVELDRLFLLAVGDAAGPLGGAGGDLAHCQYPGLCGSLCVNSTGSPPIGKSRRCGWPS